MKKTKQSVRPNKKLIFYPLFALMLVVSANIWAQIESGDTLTKTITALNVETNLEYPLTDETKSFVPNIKSQEADEWGITELESYYCACEKKDIDPITLVCRQCINCDDANADGICDIASSVEVGGYVIPSGVTVNEDGFIIGQKEVLDDGASSWSDYFYRYWTRVANKNPAVKPYDAWSPSLPKICNSAAVKLRLNKEDVAKQFGTRQLDNRSAESNIYIKNLYRAAVKYGINKNDDGTTSFSTPATLTDSAILPVYAWTRSSENGVKCLEPVFSVRVEDIADANINAMCPPTHTVEVITTSSTQPDNEAGFTVGCVSKYACGETEPKTSSKSGYANPTTCDSTYIKLYDQVDGNPYTTNYDALVDIENNTKRVKIPVRACFNCKPPTRNYCLETIRELVIHFTGDKNPKRGSITNSTQINNILKALVTNPRTYNERLPSKMTCASCLRYAEEFMKGFI